MELPDCVRGGRSAVRHLNATEVHALSMDMAMLPTNAPSILMCVLRFPPASTTATSIGQPISTARLFAASMSVRASVRLMLSKVFLFLTTQNCLVAQAGARRDPYWKLRGPGFRSTGPLRIPL